MKAGFHTVIVSRGTRNSHEIHILLMKIPLFTISDAKLINERISRICDCILLHHLFDAYYSTVTQPEVSSSSSQSYTIEISNYFCNYRFVNSRGKFYSFVIKEDSKTAIYRILQYDN